MNVKPFSPVKARLPLSPLKSNVKARLPLSPLKSNVMPLSPRKSDNIMYSPRKSEIANMKALNSPARQKIDLDFQKPPTESPALTVTPLSRRKDRSGRKTTPMLKLDKSDCKLVLVKCLFETELIKTFSASQEYRFLCLSFIRHCKNQPATPN